MADKQYLAIDMGASSGRHVVGRFNGETISLEEVYRFENGAVDVAGNLHWDLLAQWSHVVSGMRAAASQAGDGITSVGVDTWGVDFGLLGKDDVLLGNPYHYRDSRTSGMFERAFEIVSREEIFQATGLQFMELNTLYQLLAMKLQKSPLLDMAQSLLMVPDMFHWLMTGQKCNEYTEATTSQFFNPVTGTWATDLLKKFDLPTEILGEVMAPGTTLGPLRGALAADTGLTSTNVVLPGSHDTASAVAAVPASGPTGGQPDWCYISLGTWALMGIEAPKPVVTDQVMALNFTNEGGVDNTIRLLKNICGLWVVQECRRHWNLAGRDWGWEDLNGLAAAAKPLVSFIDPDASDFLAPKNMPEAICEFAKKTGQTVPSDEGAVLRCALESLAMKSRHVLGMCEDLAGRQINTIHVVGGGTRNTQLCQAMANACGRRVLAGPIEATATGNLMMQAVAAGDVANLSEARQVISNSFEMVEYLPQETAAWNDAYGRFLEVVG